MSDHAPFAPSASERWLNCPGSFAAEREHVRTSSIYAEEGTSAHAVFARALLGHCSPYTLTDDAMMAKPLHEAWLAAQQLISRRRFIVEQRLAPLPGLPDVWGTGDLIVFNRWGHVCMVVDLKFGTQVIVEPDALQLRIYALLAAQQFGGAVDGITAAILQPRALHSAGPVRTHHYSNHALSAAVVALQAGVKAALQQDAPRVSGLWCRFCAARWACPVREHELPHWSAGNSPFHIGRPKA
jgi:hypothetical protein